MGEVAKIFVAGEWVEGEADVIEDKNPYNGETIALVRRASPRQMERAIDAAAEAFKSYRKRPAYRRADMLRAVSQKIAARQEELARIIALEVAKPIRTARAEVARAVDTYRIGSEEAGRVGGEYVPMDAVPAGEGRVGYFYRQPVGVVGAITPFNFPLNLVAHKVAPALAAGNTVVVKPTEKAPLIALKLAEILEEAGFPPGTVSVVPASAEVTDILLTSPKVRKISFTGSVPVGKYIRDRVGLKKITLELGSNSANIIFPSADLDRAVDATVFGAFAHAGQSCISVQRIYLHKDVEQAFLDRFVPKVEALKLGDPLAEETDVGPMIDEPAAQKVESWIIEAREAGANLVTGGRREANMLWPTVLTRTTPEMKVVCEEVFAPLVAIASFSTVDEAIEQVNLSKYGLNAAVFTRDLGEVLRCVDELEVGQVIVNDASNFRADHMPYGGVKESGLGREGVRYAIEEMTEIKLAVIRP